jgi:hypothetical protein
MFGILYKKWENWNNMAEIRDLENTRDMRGFEK